MNILILHGVGSNAGAHWQQWLNDKLKDHGHKVMMPNLPSPEHPDRHQWLSKVQACLEGVDLSRLVIVGHSLGVPSALDFIEQSHAKVKGLVSVAGFGRDYHSKLNDYFMSAKDIDFAKVRHNLEHSAVFYGDDDPYVPQSELAELAEQLRVTPTIVEGGGHLNSDAGYTTFPALFKSVSAILKA